MKQRYDNLFNEENAKFLHFAPEKIVYDIFSQKENLDYYPVDISPETYESSQIHIRAKVDMQNIPYPDNNFDIIYNNHVLEHVPDDTKAMKELYRVLKEGGVCFTMVPLSKKYETFEKEEYGATPELRLKYYHQTDHYRSYGFDVKEKLESVGFNVELVRESESYSTLDEKEIKGLPDEDYIYICRKI